MLTVTHKAAQYLRENLTRKQEGAPEAIRIVYSQDGYHLILDDPKEGDQLFEQEGQNYLLVGVDVEEALSEATLDTQESPRGTSLALSAANTPSPSL